MKNKNSATAFLIDYLFKQSFIERPVTNKDKELILQEWKDTFPLKNLDISLIHPIINKHDDMLLFCQYGEMPTDNSPIFVVDAENEDTPVFVSCNSAELITIIAYYDLSLLRKVFKLATNKKSKINPEALKKGFQKFKEKNKWSNAIEKTFIERGVIKKLGDPIQTILKAQEFIPSNTQRW